MMSDLVVQIVPKEEFFAAVKKLMQEVAGNPNAVILRRLDDAQNQETVLTAYDPVSDSTISIYKALRMRENERRRLAEKGGPNA